MSCNETNPCFGGLCQDGACNCFALWTGDYCDTNVLSLDETMYRFFWGYLWSILIIFALITIAALVQLALLIVDYKRTARRLNKVKVMLFALIAAIGIIKIIWASLDPHKYYMTLPLVAEGLLNQFTYWGIVALYALILLLWFRVYLVSRFATKNVQRFRAATIALIVYFFAVYVVFECAQVFFIDRSAELAMAGLYAISIAALTIGGSIWFLVFGGRLLKTMKMHKDLPKRDKAVRKVSIFVRGVSISTIVTFTLLSILIPLNFLQFDSAVIIFIISNLLQRLVQAGFCIFILVFYRSKYLRSSSEASSSLKTSNSVYNMTSTNHSTKSVHHEESAV